MNSVTLTVLCDADLMPFFPGIIAANAVVFCCWRVPSLQRSMIRYFTSNPASSERRHLCVCVSLCCCGALLSNVCVLSPAQRRSALP